jgi:hypothetical protein
MEKAVNLPEIFTKRIYIRLEGDALICTVRYAELYGRLTKYVIGPPGVQETDAQQPRSDEGLIHLRKPPNAG